VKNVEVLYFRGCPNHAETLDRVQEVVSALDIDARIVQIEVKTLADVERLRFLGSPSVRVDGVDVEPGVRASRAFGLACRTYGRDGIPPRALIAAALTGAKLHESMSGVRGALAAAPGLGALLLPVGTCPACWPAYAGFLSSLGLGFLVYERYVVPVALALLLVAVGSLAHRARERRGHGPVLVALLGVVTALVGKFRLSSGPVLYVGFGLLVAATLWNGWPRAGGTPGPAGSARCGKARAENERAQVWRSR